MRTAVEKSWGIVASIMAAAAVALSIAIATMRLSESAMDRHGVAVGALGLLSAAAVILFMRYRLSAAGVQLFVDPVAAEPGSRTVRGFDFLAPRMERWSAILGFSGAALIILSFVSFGEGGASGMNGVQSGTHVGGLYSIAVDDEYKVVKVLAVEGNAISLRVYDGSYDQRPSAVDPSDLTVDDPALDVAERGLPAFAMEPGVFVTMQPSLLSV